MHALHVQQALQQLQQEHDGGTLPPGVHTLQPAAGAAAGRCLAGQLACGFF